MQLWNVGDGSEAICGRCKGLRPTTFALRSVPLPEAKVDVADVLVAVCDGCGEIAAIPAQSTPLLRAALVREPAKIIARINRRLEDAIRLIAFHYGTNERDFRSILVRYYLVELSHSAAFAKRVTRLAHSELVRGPKTGRLEVRLRESALTTAWAAAQEAGMCTQTEMIEGVIAAATEDVLEHRTPRRAARLQELAALA